MRHSKIHIIKVPDRNDRHIQTEDYKALYIPTGGKKRPETVVVNGEVYIQDHSRGSIYKHATSMTIGVTDEVLEQMQREDYEQQPTVRSIGTG